MQKLLDLPKRGLSGFLRRATPAEAAAVLRQTLDEGLLKQLGPFAAVHPYRLEAQVTDLHMLVVSPKPTPGGAESSGQVCILSCGELPPVYSPDRQADPIPPEGPKGVLQAFQLLLNQDPINHDRPDECRSMRRGMSA